jgi:hypothetical protein
MSNRFLGGLVFSRLRYVSTPLVELRATADALSFNVRFGLGRIWVRGLSIGEKLPRSEPVAASGKWELNFTC